MWDLIKLFIEIARREKHWPLILLVAIIPVFWFCQLFFELKFRETLSHWSFLIGCGLICVISGVLDWAIVYRTWRRLYISAPVAILGCVLVVIGIPRPCHKETLPSDMLVVTVAHFAPATPGASEDAGAITHQLLDDLHDNELNGAPLRAKLSPIRIDVNLKAARRTEQLNQLGTSCEGNAHIVLSGVVNKIDGEVSVRAYLTVTNDWHGQNVEDQERLLDSNSRQITAIKLKDERWVAKSIADMVTLIRGLAYYKTSDWNEAIRIFTEADSDEGNLYKGLCYYERAQQNSNRKADLLSAIETYKKIDLKPEEADLSYAAYFNLANAYMAYGESLAGQDAIASFRAAADAYKAAWRVYEREEIPWAVENNLGVALFKLGTRDVQAGGIKNQYLLGAVDAHRRALLVCAREERNQKEQNREALRQNRALTHNNLGSVLAKLGEVSNATEKNSRFAEAREEFEAALEFYDREKYPKRWAMARNNLANVLVETGKLTDGAQGNQILRDAVEAYRTVLVVYNREEYPEQYARTQYNRGYTLGNLGERLDGTERIDCFRDAAIAYRAVSEVSCPAALPQLCAKATHDLQHVIAKIGQH